MNRSPYRLVFASMVCIFAAAAAPVGVAASGAGWSLLRTPNPSAPASQTLSAVSCTSATFCMAVGSAQDALGTSSTAEIWNGTGWLVAAAPRNASRATANVLTGVSCPTSTDCVAVGWYRTAGRDYTLTESWNGETWKAHGIPGVDGGTLAAVSCASTGFCLAIGQLIGATWNGSVWSAHALPKGTAGALNSVSCTSAVFCMAAGSASSTWNGKSFIRHPLAAKNGGVLWDVSCASGHACQAVGHYAASSSQDLPLAEQWNGASWRVRGAPKAPGTSNGWLTGVSCATAISCIAVGHSLAVPGHFAPGDFVPLAEKWNGSDWTLVASPTTAYIDAVLTSVSCLSSATCDAVGHGYQGPNHLNLYGVADSLSGSTWAMQSVADVPGSELSELHSVDCSSSGFCMAVGGFPREFFRGVGPNFESTDAIESASWNGHVWAFQPVLGLGSNLGIGTLMGVSCTSSTACLAVGDTAGSAFLEVWNGTVWSLSGPAQSRVALDSVSCNAPSACVAVGALERDQPYATFAESISASGATALPMPALGPSIDSQLNGVSCSSANSCMAVGINHETATSTAPLAELWDGSKWTLTKPVLPSDLFGQIDFLGVSCSTASACEAVGYYNNDKGGRVSLAESWNGSKWTLEAVPHALHAITMLTSVSCAGPGSCTAVGTRTIDGHTSALSAVRSSSVWSLPSTPSPPGAIYSALAGVSCPTSASCMTVGSYALSTLLPVSRSPSVVSLSERRP